MSKQSTARRINVGALLVAAPQSSSSSCRRPTCSPPSRPESSSWSPAAAIVAFAPGRWTPVIGVLIPLMITIGGIASGNTIDILNGEHNAGAILGTVIQYPALITAIAAGVMGLPRRSATLRGASGDRATNAFGRPYSPAERGTT